MTDSTRLTKKQLFSKYDVPAPRYTSYPTVPHWEGAPEKEFWISAVKDGLASGDGWSMYVHIPFCETLCTFCGCNTTITRNHDKEKPYLDIILKEWALYVEKVPELQKAPLKHIHLGGGTPNFFSARHLHDLVAPIMKAANVSQTEFEGSIEVDPRRLHRDQLQALYELGFRRVSLGVQDYNDEVQRLINRVQPYSMTEQTTNMAREVGYTSVNFDLIYGLPMQTIDSFKTTAMQTLQLRPDRIALYSYAKVPWIKPAQRLFKDEDLPEGAEKRSLYELAREILLDGGYLEIGMDHFALPEDGLALAAKEKRLHRNFMGYSDQKTNVLLGLGVSSISETPTCFHQNEKVLPVYEREITSGNLPTFRGHVLTEEDMQQRQQILKFMNEFCVDLRPEQVDDVRTFLKPMFDDELVHLSGHSLTLTDKGRPFLRNACMALDLRLRRSQSGVRAHSQAI